VESEGKDDTIEGKIQNAIGGLKATPKGEISAVSRKQK
jgi:uncharacterized protein YjbJ (UPF0337 family)